MDFLKGAKDFARNPLGIIALFISLIYGFASLLLDSSAEKLTIAERWPLIIFIVAFPVMVLVAFYKLVTNHHGKLYAPGDFKDDKSFLRTLSQEEQEKKLDKEVSESMGVKEPEEKFANEDLAGRDTQISQTEIAEAREKIREEYRLFREEIKNIENSVIDMIATELKVTPERNVGISDLDSQFDAFLQSPSGKFTFLEVKALRSPGPAMMILDRLLYNAVVANNFFESKFKLIIAVVYYFEESELERVESFWRRRVSKCPAEVELRFISRNKIKMPNH